MTDQIFNPKVTVEALPTPFGAPGATHRVLKFDHIIVPKDRGIFWKKDCGFFYGNGATCYAYSKVYSGGDYYQAITVAGVRIQVTPRSPIIETHAGVPLLVGEEYRLRNNKKVKIIKFVNDPAYCNEPQYVGIYTQNGDLATIRFNGTGTVLSHGNEADYNITEVWVEKEVWIALYRNGANIQSATFTGEDQAKRWAKSNLPAHVSVKIFKETV